VGNFLARSLAISLSRRNLPHGVDDDDDDDDDNNNNNNIGSGP